MLVRTQALFTSIALAVSLLATGCGSSSEPASLPDGSADLPVSSPDIPATMPDGPLGNDAAAAPDTIPPRLDAAAPPDAAHDIASTGVDTSFPPLDGGSVAWDGAIAEAGGIDLASVGLDGGTGAIDAALPAADAAKDVAADVFVPGPAVPIVVNSGSTGDYSLADGAWKVFYFDATAGQLYCIAKLGDIVTGYVGTSPSISPTDYQYATGSEGTLAFTATAAQRYYVAVAASGGDASGWVQVADGGQLLVLGANTVPLPAPDLDNTYFFRFPVTAGHSYGISVTGPAATTIGLSVSPQAERGTNGQYLIPSWSTSAPLPITNEAISSTSVALSYSGFYFFSVHVYAAMTLSVTLAQTS
jgi:hypothetical protein